MTIDFRDTELPNPTTAFEREVTAFIAEWNNPLPTVKVQTSGSTGVPKVFEVEKERMVYSARRTCDILSLAKGDTALLCLPVQYISGKMMVVRAMERKLTLIIKTPSVQPVADLQNPVDFCAMSPLQAEHSSDKIKLIRKLILGGAAVSETLKKRIQETAGPENHVYETYGMSETLSHIALKQIHPIEEDFFTVLEGIQITADERGCLVIDAPQLHAGKLITNDLVEIRGRDRFRFLGRIDHVINSGGLKIYPEELEQTVKRTVPREVVFAGVPDEELGQKLIMIIEGADEPYIRPLLDTIEYPTKNHRPKEVYFVPQFPRISNGKVNRRELLNLLP